VAKKQPTDAEAKQLRRLGHRIKEARLKKGWTQTELADLASRPGSKVNLRRIQAIEKGETNLQFSTAMFLLEAVGLKEKTIYESLPSSAHSELHRRLQELLDADEPWATAARINVDAVYGHYLDEKRKASS
jgi:transcriptional regulator with XRE-family HTH domain